MNGNRLLLASNPWLTSLGQRLRLSAQARAGKRPRTEDTENIGPESGRTSQSPGPDEEDEEDEDVPELHEGMSQEEQKKQHATAFKQHTFAFAQGQARLAEQRHREGFI